MRKVVMDVGHNVSKAVAIIFYWRKETYGILKLRTTNKSQNY